MAAYYCISLQNVTRSIHVVIRSYHLSGTKHPTLGAIVPSIGLPSVWPSTSASFFGLKFRAGGVIITNERKRKRRRKEKEKGKEGRRERERRSCLLDTMGIVVAACRRCCVVATCAPRCRRQRDELLAHEPILFARRRPLYY